MPKSSTFTSPPDSTMFAGLISRWTRPTAWAGWRPSHTAAAIATASSGGSAPATSSICRNVRPATSSITMNGVVPSTPQSKTVTRRGWLRAAACRASRSNLARKAASAAYCGLRILTATSRPRTSSRPRHTVDTPPTPSTSRSAYRPPNRGAPVMAVVLTTLTLFWRSCCILRGHWSRRQDECGEQPVRLGVGVLGQPGVDRAGLHHGAARGREPAEPAPDLLLARWSRGAPLVADTEAGGQPAPRARHIDRPAQPEPPPASPRPPPPH